MRRALVYCLDFHPREGGYSFAFQNLVRGMVEEDQEIAVDVVTMAPLGNSPEWVMDRVRIIRFHQWTRIKFIRGLWYLLMRPWLIGRLIRELDAEKHYNFILLETIDDPMVAAMLPRYLLPKTIVRIHAAAETEHAQFMRDASSRLRREIIRFCLQRRIRNISSTNSHHIQFVKHWFLDDNDLLIANKRFFVIPNSVAEVDQTVTPRIDLPIRLVTLGRMDNMGINQKGFEDVLLALSLLPVPIRQRLALLVIGKGSERTRLIRLTEELGLDNVCFIESMPNEKVQDELRHAHAVVLASRYEGQSMFALEGLARGCAVIYARTGGLVDLVSANGWGFPPGDVAALARVLGELAHASPQRLAGLSRRSIELARDNHLPVRTAQALFRFTRLVEHESRST